ncbi:allergen Fel d 4 [Rousettus aegyptiacus]|uniref:allergen Fel d 4 n=1 Tax=Rousettus aegyptiacus TaxID=9407 RepID=UPI00168D6217|nr:allergen Fel d 4 [Rousettus aegyptiacus]
MMKLLLLCLGLTLVCAHPAVVTKNFDYSKLSGEWYTILLSSNDKEAIQEDGVYRPFLEYANVLNNSTLALLFHLKINKECVPVTVLAHKISENAVLNINYTGMDILHIIEAVYDDYMIVRMFKSDPMKTYFEVGLFARTPDESPEVKEEFTRVVQKFGIPKGNILDLTKIDRCLEAREKQAFPDSRLVIRDGEGWSWNDCLLVH